MSGRLKPQNLPYLICAVVLNLLFLPACQPAPAPTQPPIPVSSPTANPTAVISPETTPTPPPSELSLRICLGAEPKSLFWFAADAAARLVLSAVYDGPFETQNFNNLPVIVEKAPSLADGDVRLEPVALQAGMRLADASGQPTVLQPGTSYRPSGCASLDCSQTYQDEEAITVDQMVVQFRLKPGLVWSDGSPMTAADSVYAYEIARALQPPAWLGWLERTQSYQAVDELTVEWRGLPGSLGGGYAEKFILPLPRHAWGGMDAAALPDDPIAARSPLGWGAYLIEAWVAGEEITLRLNPNYWRASEGLPAFDRLVFRFVQPGEAAVQSLLNGECDVLAPGAVNESQAAQALELQDQGLAQIFIQPAVAWEQITLGVSRVDGIPSPFASPQVRQAAALCIDRQALAGQVLDGLAQPASGMLAPGYPAALTTGGGYDPTQAQELLQAAGWMDGDNDAATPRTASGAAGFADGTPLRVIYLTAPDADRQAAANYVSAALAQCGFQVEVASQPFDVYLAAGPDGPVFGRKFDLAQFAWPAAGVESLCGLYLSSEIPGPYPQYPKGWGGGNAGGFSSPAFDQSCQALRSTPPDAPLFTQALEQVQAVFQAEAPAIPLYWRYRLALARPDLCGAQVDASTGAFTWNIETWRLDQGCGGD